MTENDRAGGGAVYRGESCVLCGDDLTNELARDTGVCDDCSGVDLS